MRNSFNLLATAISVFTAKSIPLIISMYLVLKMSLDDYADWIYLFQFVLLASSGLGTVINTEFSKRFKKDDHQKFKLNIYIGSIDLYILVFMLLAISILLKENGIFIVFSVILLFILNTVNNYILLAFRFGGQYNYLVILSMLRIFSFLPILLFRTVSLEDLLIIMLISLSIPVILVCYKFKLILHRYSSENEIAWLVLYGLTTSLFVTFERFFLKFIEIDNNDYATIVYAVSLVMMIVPLVEVIKQYLVPELYMKYREKSYTMFRDKRVLVLLSTMFLAQAVFPIFIYTSLSIFNLLPKFMYEFPYINLALLSFAFAVYSLYHFLNPVLFLMERSRFLLLYQILGIILFMSLYIMNNSFYVSKFIAFLFVIVLVIYHTSRLRRNYG